LPFTVIVELGAGREKTLVMVSVSGGGALPFQEELRMCHQFINNDIMVHG